MDKIKTTSQLLELAKEASNWIKGEKSDRLELDCMRNLGIYTTTINVESKFSKWLQKSKLGNISKKFDSNKVYNIKAYSLKPIAERLHDVVVFYDDYIELDLSKLNGRNVDTFRLEIEYYMEDEVLDGLVKSRTSPEDLEDRKKFHISAQLKDPESLTSGFSEVEIDEYPVKAKIFIQEEIDTGIPKFIRDMAKTESEILSDYNPRGATKIIGLQKKRYKLKKKLGKDDLIQKLNDLSVFLRPGKFVKYVQLESKKDFRIHCCEPGTSLFRALGMLTLPKSMKVITRTDLNLNKIASSGVMVYHSGELIDEVEDLFY